MRLSLAVRLALDFADARALLSKRHSNGANFSVHSCSKNDATSTSLSDSRGAVGDVEAVTGAGVLVENSIAIFVDWERFTGKKSLISFKVQCFDNTVCKLVTY